MIFITKTDVLRRFVLEEKKISVQIKIILFLDQNENAYFKDTLILERINSIHIITRTFTLPDTCLHAFVRE